MAEILNAEQKGNSLVLLLKDVDMAFINALRRTIMNGLPVLAIEDVSIYDNSGTLFDEFLAHRLGMLPIVTDLKTYKEGDKVKFMLEEEGPKTVYSKDLKCTDPKIEVFDKKIPITTLSKGQRIKLEAEAIVGKGKDHVKWQPAMVTYEQLPLNSAVKASSLCEKCAKDCSEKLEVKNARAYSKDPMQCNLCSKCQEARRKGLVNIDYKDSAILLTVESFGNMDAKEVVEHALKNLSERTESFIEKVTALK